MPVSSPSLDMIKSLMSDKMKPVLHHLDQGLLVRFLHGAVSASIFVSIICAVIFVWTAKIDWHNHDFFTHGFKNMAYLFSFWVSACQVVYFNIYSAIDIIDIYSRKKPNLQDLKERLHTIASYLLFMVVFPLSLVVSVLFWTFYWVNREAMYPPVMDNVFPPLLNHIMHTFPAIFAVIYMFTSNKNEPPKTITLAGLLGFLAVYGACIVSVKIRSGKWVYLVLEHMTPLEMKCTFTLSLIGSVSFLFLGYLINDKIKTLRRKLFM